MAINKSKKKVVFLMDKSSIVAKGLEKKLEAEGYQTVSLIEKYDKMEEHAQDADLFVVYNPQGIIDAKHGTNNIVLIKDQIKDKGCNLILIGEAGEKEVLLKEYPDFIRYVWMDRPVEPENFVNVVAEEIANHDKRLARKAAQADAPKPVESGDPREPLADDDMFAGGLKKILIVDDDPSYAGMVRSWIKDRYKTDIVTAGMQAITFLMKRPVDLILLDYEMPVVDGPQVLQMLRQEETTKNIPVVFLTGVNTAAGVKRVMELKPAGYILKSTSSEDLIAFLDEKLN